MLLWDGEDFDPARTQKLVSQLAQLPHLRAVWVAGVTTESRHDLRAQVERTFEPLGSQLIVSGPYDTQDGLESFRQALKGEE
jgi:uncharacterized Zn finger protein